MSTVSKDAQAASYDTCTARDHVAVTKSDTTDYNPPFRAVYVGTGGDVAITSLGGTAVTYKNVPSGTTLHVAGTHILSAGTSASDIVAQF